MMGSALHSKYVMSDAVAGIASGRDSQCSQSFNKIIV